MDKEQMDKLLLNFLEVSHQVKVDSAIYGFAALKMTAEGIERIDPASLPSSNGATFHKMWIDETSS